MSKKLGLQFARIENVPGREKPLVIEVPSVMGFSELQNALQDTCGRAAADWTITLDQPRGLRLWWLTRWRSRVPHLFRLFPELRPWSEHDLHPDGTADIAKRYAMCRVLD